MVLSSFLQKLLFVNQFSINDGKVNLLGSNYVMLESSDIILLQEIDNSKAYAFGKSIAKKQISNIIEHAKVYNGIKTDSIKSIIELNKKLQGSEDGKIKVLEDLFNLHGLGKLEIVNLDNKNKEAILNIKRSTIAEEYLKNKGKSKGKKCSCVLTAGILAGMFTFLFDKEVECMEEQCLAEAKDVCIFKIK